MLSRVVCRSELCKRDRDKLYRAEKYREIFNDGFEVDAILKNISLLNPELKFIPGDTIFFFDELQACPNCATSLKFLSSTAVST